MGSLTILLVRIIPPDIGTHHANPGLGILYEGLCSVPGVKQRMDSVSYWLSYVRGHPSSGLADMQSARREKLGPSLRRRRRRDGLFTNSTYQYNKSGVLLPVLHRREYSCR